MCGNRREQRARSGAHACLEAQLGDRRHRAGTRLRRLDAGALSENQDARHVWNAIGRKADAGSAGLVTSRMLSDTLSDR